MSGEEKQYHGLLQSTTGVMSMGTPHDGADKAKLFSTAGDIAGSLVTLNTTQVKMLEHGSEQLQEISRAFGLLIFNTDLQIVTVIESDKTRILGTNKLASTYLVYLASKSTLTGQDCRSSFCSSQSRRSRKSPQRCRG